MKRVAIPLLCFTLFGHAPLTASYLRPISAEGNTIPFRLFGSAIIVEASVDGTTGNFFFDTGSKELLLNNAYFQGRANPLVGPYYDLYGSAVSVDVLDVKKISMQGVALPSTTAYVLDLSGSESAIGIQLAGVLGYSSFKDFELLFDFQEKQITLFPLSAAGFASYEPFFIQPPIHWSWAWPGICSMSRPASTMKTSASSLTPVAG